MDFFRDLSIYFVIKLIGTYAGLMFLCADPLPGQAQYVKFVIKSVCMTIFNTNFKYLMACVPHTNSSNYNM
jgi:hypothetical protein